MFDIKYLGNRILNQILVEIVSKLATYIGDLSFFQFYNIE